MANKNELKAAMIRKGYSRSTLAEALNMSPSTLTYKMSNKRDFASKEIAKITKILELSADERDQIFFAYDVDRNETTENAKKN